MSEICYQLQQQQQKQQRKTEVKAKSIRLLPNDTKNKK